MRYLFALVLLLLSWQAEAKGIPGAANFGRTCNGGGALCYNPPLTPSLFYNFTSSLPNGSALSRTTTAWYFNSSGNLIAAAPNTARFDYGTPGSSTLIGLLYEGASTNPVLWNRDFTNPVWSTVNMTAALDQTGIDAGSNTASSLTASANFATICQTITQAASNSSFSIYIKRLSGSGVVAISQDNNITNTNVTLSGSWARFVHAPQSTLNPNLCIQINTSGDSIAVDAAQLDTGLLGGTSAYASSPILTTSASVNRASESLSFSELPIVWFNKNSGAFVSEWQPNVANCGGSALSIVTIGGYSIGINNGNITVPSGSFVAGTASANVVRKVGATYSFQVFDAANNGTLFARSNALSASAGSLTFNHGCNTVWLRKFTYWPYPLTASQLQLKTQ